MFDAPTPSLGELRRAMATAQQAVPVPFTQVEVVDTDARPGLVNDLTRWLGASHHMSAVMITEKPPPSETLSPPPGLTVREQPFPDLETCLRLVRAGHSDEEPLAKAVLAQLVTRDTSVLAPAGTRFFTGSRKGDVVSYASLLTLAGVGLIDTVATVPEHRRQGAAMAVVGAAIAACTALHNQQAVLFTREGGTAQRLYGRLGMRAIARAIQFGRVIATTADRPLAQ